MFKQFASLDELKRVIYLCVVPLVFVALILNALLQKGEVTNTLNFIVNITLIFWLVISWILLHKVRFVRFVEYSNLVLLSVYHITTFSDTIKNYMLEIGGALGDFIVWMPIYFIFIFLTLGAKRGLHFSVAIFAVTVGNGIIYITQLSSESLGSILQFYFANFVYIIVIYYSQHIFKAYAKVDLLKQHAYLDSLTGIANRRQIDEWLEHKVMHSQKIQLSFSLIFFDIDYFKKVNDLYGHKTGDSVLIELAELIQTSLAKRNLLGRWGGEEFIIISDVGGKDAVKLAEQLRKKVEEHDFQGVGTLTASFGVTDSKQGDTIDSLLSRVDEGLYQSKNYGRNKVSIS
ncbi:MAG: GGDEF domain-containing protein [Bacillus sp. (in: Bacteria)]|nr:GGDEF domain-containing protein [Bacillus sp. (in: firmicutes)]